MENPFKYRIRICFFVFVCLFLLLFLRAFYLQVVPDSRLKKAKERQSSATLTITSPRGTIYDRNGRALAISVEASSVFIDPSLIRWTKKEIRQVSKLLDVSTRILKNKSANKSRRFVWIKRKIDSSTAKKVRELGIDGVYMVQEWDRLYPDRESASQTIGVVGRDGNGLEGIEKYYDDFLKSEPTTLQINKDAKGRVINVDRRFSHRGKEGADLFLTIDSTIQYILERELIANAIRHKVKQAMGIVIDPNTGEILAMTAFPQSNPNRLVTRKDILALRNLNIVDAFEPGSTLKVFVMAGALEQSLIKENEIFDCREGSLKIGKKVIANPVEKAWLVPRDILKFSNNVGIARIGLRMGKEKVVNSLEKFGFGSRTGIDFPSESSGMFEKSGNWHDMRLANVSFGQGIAATPVQLVRALSILANGGYLVQPHLVKKIGWGSEEEISLVRNSEFRKQIISGETVRIVQSWMEAVTQEDGTGFRGKVPGYRTAGKTGTAQIFDPETKSYSHDELVASFFGFAPLPNAELAALIIYRQPVDSRYGGEIAAPVFQKVMKQALQYRDELSDEQKFTPMQMVKPDRRINSKKVDASLVPNFINMTLREAIDFSEEHAIDLEIHGSGVVFKQDPKHGQDLGKKKVRLYLRT